LFSKCPVKNSSQNARSNINILSPNIPLQVDEYDIVDKRVDDLALEKKTEIYRKVIPKNL
jgi:hypothetical protein